MISLALALAIAAPSLEVAEKYWGAGNCSGEAKIEVMSGPELLSIRADEAYQAGIEWHNDTSIGDGNPNNCNIRVSNTINNRASFCTLIVHEVGHLRRFSENGNDHSSIYGHVMNTTERRPLVDCIYRFPPKFVARQKYIPKPKRWNCQPNAVMHVWTCKRKGKYPRDFYENDWDK